MVNRLKPLTVQDFTGGVNLRPEAFQLLDNELPDMLNLEVDPRGGLNVRKSWIATTPRVTTGTWNPRLSYMLVTSTGGRWTLVANNSGGNGEVLAQVGAGAAWTAYPNPAPSASPHVADFCSWGDNVVVCRGQGATAFFNGVTMTALTACALGNWQNDYLNPGVADTAPQAELNANHMGYLFTAATREDAIPYPSRLRWSHPNNPKRWAQSDFIDILEGGQKITALIPFADRLLIFKPDSVWALFGYDADTWELTNITRTVGCVHQQAVCRSEQAVYFLAWPQGIFAYTDKGVSEISLTIRAVFQPGRMDQAAINNIWFGWVNRRLWCSLPYNDKPPAPLDAQTVFVYDPVLSPAGSWTMFRGGGGQVPGPYIERVDADQDPPFSALNRATSYPLMLAEYASQAEDEYTPDTPTQFPTRMRTRWIDAGAPTWKKSWRRPDFLLRALRANDYVNVRVFHDFDNSNAQRSFLVGYTPDVPVPLWGSFKYGDGTVYGGSDQTSSVERGGTMGRAGTVQIEINGQPGVSWGLNGIIFKFIPRRLR